MTIVYQQIGNTVAQWDDGEPLRWSMEDVTGNSDERKIVTKNFDFTPLLSGYEIGFLIALRDFLIQRRFSVRINSIHTQAQHFKLLLMMAHREKIVANKVAQIDRAFLVGLSFIAEKIPLSYLKTFFHCFNSSRNNSTIFCSTLTKGDFPKRNGKRGEWGEFRHRVLGSALKRSALVAILDTLETGFENGELDIGLYAFGKLALHIFCRPESYYQIRLQDLQIDTNPQTGETNYFLDVIPAKSGVNNPEKITYRLDPHVGELLALQRKSVTNFCGHLFEADELPKVALFPARGHPRKNDGLPWGKWPKHRYGMIRTASDFTKTYLYSITNFTKHNFNFHALRHTVGTQLAQTGCSAATIAALLKHATEDVCQAYVDLVFDGLIDELSDALEPAFEQHFPVFKDFCAKQDITSRERAIVAFDENTKEAEKVALCGRRSICQYAPLACYECPRFIPCWDADHSINLRRVEREISAFDGQGLALANEVKKYKHIRNCIRVVITACEMKRRAIEQEDVR